MTKQKKSSRGSEIKKLEEHLAFMDNHIAEQDKEIMNLRQKLDKAIEELKTLRDYFDSGALTPGDTREKPPHY